MIRPLTPVYGEWLFRDNCWDFVVDNVKGARMCFLSDSSTHSDLVEMAQENYNMDTNREVVDFTYSLPEDMMQQMAPDTPPIHVISDRQVWNLIEICKTHDVRLCVSSRGRMIVWDATEVSDEGEDVNEVSDKGEEEDYENGNEVSYKGEEEDYEDGNEEEEDADVPNFVEVDEDDFVDYCVYGKVKDEDEDEVEAEAEAEDMCFEGLKAPYASERGSSNMAFSDNIYVNQSFVSREALVSELRLTAVKRKFSFKLYNVTKTLVVAKYRVAGCGWKLRVGVKHGTNTFWVTKYLKTHTCGKRNCIVDVQQIKCDCGVYGIEKIHYSHAIAAGSFSKLHIASIVSPLYSREHLYAGYSHNPCAGEVEICKCLPPEVKRGPGRQKKSRWQSWLEISRFRGHKPSKLDKDYSCSNCKQPGHTRPNGNQPIL
ncbi:hypothetical protein F2Q70_00036054 [Brassica cretica]|uniref:Transposase MuDR plant domain-containing protein n=1 Tax=Brassica cretica TaxID=69181 RepID=A0A8S9K0C6_BRACR|nr:hypothetical protein F2Q70_00036054 [Brassica cretica]